jgi:hypothetical protein
MDRELASSTTTRILRAWPPAVFTLPQAPGFEDWDPVEAGKNYDMAGFVASCRANRVTPHVAQNDGREGGSAIDGRTTRCAGYAIGQGKRKCIEQWFLLTQAAYNYLTPPTPTLPRPALK